MRGQIRCQEKEVIKEEINRSVSLISDICGHVYHGRILVILTHTVRGCMEMLYQNQYQYHKKAHSEIEYIFHSIFPVNGLNVRMEQIRLCHVMLDALMQGKIGLCDAGVGIGKTYAYLVACILLRKYAATGGRFLLCDTRPVVISTSSIALQEALIQEYIPFLSRVLMESGIIQAPIRAVVRKGKEHFVCEERLETRLEAVRDKKKNEGQKDALLKLRISYDMDEVHGLSGFDRRLVCVPKFCPKECANRNVCRYQQYLKQAKSSDIYFQICNHNYLLADAMHREKDYRPLLPDYRGLIVDEAHKLPEAARQMCGKTICYEDAQEICFYLEKELPGIYAKQVKGIFHNLFCVISENHRTDDGLEASFSLTEECKIVLKEGINAIQGIFVKTKGNVSKWITNRLEEMEGVLQSFYVQDARYVYHLMPDKSHFPVMCASSREIPNLLSEMLWSRDFPVILTSGTLRSGKGFERTRQVIGLEKEKRVQEFVAKSPFAYEKNCMLYLPQTIKSVRRGSREEVMMLAGHIQKLICSTYGHTLVLFTSYHLMGSVYQILRDSLPFPMVEVWRHSQDEIGHFKSLENAVLFAAGPCWEGVDFPGDMVSSLIIVRLPFAVPDPISEAEKSEYETFPITYRLLLCRICR